MFLIVTVGDRRLPPKCPKCGNHTRIVGQSGTPPVMYYRCEVCGHIFGRPLDEPPPEFAA
jgi:tRNA(Ile2) C34 agmatinyltransferase TiaS